MKAVHEFKGKWWFYNEIWSGRKGPWDTEKDAEGALCAYAKMLDGHPEDWALTCKLMKGKMVYNEIEVDDRTWSWMYSEKAKVTEIFDEEGDTVLQFFGIKLDENVVKNIVHAYMKGQLVGKESGRIEKAFQLRKALGL